MLVRSSATKALVDQPHRQHRQYGTEGIFWIRKNTLYINIK